MEEDQSHMTEEIWSLTLEVVCLLTGETFPVMSGDHVTMKVTPPPSWMLERLTMQKILEISNKITKLLIGEVPMKCPEAAVCLSMEERECRQEHDGLHSKMEVQPLILSVQSLHPLYSQDSTQEGHLTQHDYQVPMKCPEAAVCLSMEERECRQEHDELHSKMEVQPLILSVQSLHPLYSQDSTQEGHLTQHDYQTGIKEEELVVEAPGNSGVTIKAELSSCPVTPERPLLAEHGDEAAGEETGVRSDECCMEENISPVTGEAVHQDIKSDLIHPKMSSNCKTEEDDTVERISSHSKCGKNVQLLTTEQRSFPSSECGTLFSCKSQLVKHQKVHSEEKPYFCTSCGKCFARKENLIQHVRIHTGEKPFSCTECGKCFSRKNHLIKHKQVHSGDKPYSCTECDKCFSRKENLMAHQRVHTGVKPYSCSYCKKCFYQKTDLIIHVRIHTGEKPFSCTECGRCFNSKGALVRHERVHNRVKPYSCSECGKCFNSKPVLFRHERVHKRVKPYSCT